MRPLAKHREFRLHTRLPPSELRLLKWLLLLMLLQHTHLHLLWIHTSKRAHGRNPSHHLRDRVHTPSVGNHLIETLWLRLNAAHVLERHRGRRHTV